MPPLSNRSGMQRLRRLHDRMVVLRRVPYIEKVGHRCFKFKSLKITADADIQRVALQNAASVAGLMITNEAMVAELPKDDSPMGGGDMGGMGGMM